MKMQPNFLPENMVDKVDFRLKNIAGTSMALTYNFFQSGINQFQPLRIGTLSCVASAATEVTGVVPGCVGNVCVCHVCNGLVEEAGKGRESGRQCPNSFQLVPWFILLATALPPKDNWWLNWCSVGRRWNSPTLALWRRM